MLPKKHKLKKENFTGLQKWKSFHSPHFTLRIKEAPPGELSKLSFVVAKKISKKSTIRNKLKRLGYRAAHEVITRTKDGVLCAFFFKTGSKERLSYETVREEVFFLLKKSGVLS